MKAWKNLLQTAAACLHYTHSLEAGQEKLSCGSLIMFVMFILYMFLYIRVPKKKRSRCLAGFASHTSRVRLGKSEQGESEIRKWRKMEKDGERWRKRRERVALPEKKMPGKST